MMSSIRNQGEALLSEPSIVGISGNFSRPSRTRALVEAVVAAVAERTGGRPAVYDILDAGPALGAALSPATAAPEILAILDAIRGADVLVVGSPVYKGSYTGLFKHLFDLVEPKALAGKPVILSATGGSDRHALVIEHQYHPLFAFFGAAIVPTGLYATERDFDGYEPGEALAAKIGQAAAEAASRLPPPSSGP